MFCATGCEESRAPATSDHSAVATTTNTADATAARAAKAESNADGKLSATEPPAKDASAPATGAKPAAAAVTGTQNITFDTLKFPLEKNERYEPSRLTAGIEALNGHSVKLRGYILPSFQQSGITQFVLVRDNQECCFGPGAALYDCVVVDMKPGKTTEYTVRPVAVEGKFELRDFKGPDGKYLAIYHLDGETVGF